MLEKELLRLKKDYGENFAKLCKTLFPSLLEMNILYETISENFAPSHLLYNDLIKGNKVENFKNYIMAKSQKYLSQELQESTLSPFDLMRQAGYTLYKCETNEDVQSFKKWWTNGESLCTFRDPQRIKTHLVFFAVKDGATIDGINGKTRKDFTHPKRQDEYGTSVIGIQFSKGSINNISIKNRYNHTVANPDATFSNDLENIIAGLSQSFIKFYKLKLVSTQQGFEICDYVLANDGKFYKYNHEIDGIYYCPNNIIIENGNAIQYDKSRYELIDYYLIDKQEKTIKILGETFQDSLPNTYGKINNIEIIKNGNNKEIIFHCEDGIAKVVIDNHNRIIKYHNEFVIDIGNNFLSSNRSLTEFIAPKLETIGNNFLFYNNKLTELNLPNLITIGENFLAFNLFLKTFNVPKLKTMGNYCLRENDSLNVLSAPSLTLVGDNCLSRNTTLAQLDIPNLTSIGNYFLFQNTSIKEFYAPNLTSMGKGCLHHDRCPLIKFNAPKLTIIGDGCLKYCPVSEFIVPNLKTIGDNCLLRNTDLSEFNAPNLISIGKNFLCENEFLRVFNAPNLTYLGYNSLIKNRALTEFYAPKLPKGILRYFLEIVRKNEKKNKINDNSSPNNRNTIIELN